MSRIAVIPTEIAMKHWQDKGAFVKDREPELTPFNAAIKRKKDAEAKRAFRSFDFDGPEAA